LNKIKDFSEITGSHKESFTESGEQTSQASRGDSDKLPLEKEVHKEFVYFP